MSRALQDQFIEDDEEETCPLCVEEFDIGDKGFFPCPCGYQICQFCYNSVKNHMNGLCPACRRPYNDADIEIKEVTPEEAAAHKARQAQKQKKSQAALQKEKAKAEADNLSRKHLAGLRVVQKNLVYVTGLQPTKREDELLQTLRKDEYFGQYGKIIKIVVSKAKDPSHPNSVGVYVTFENKEDAARCIAAVNGTKNLDRTLRAQCGTTKYCSAYLRGETCQNRNCMFLHEPGEANESYSRFDLSALNVGTTNQGGRAPSTQSQQPTASTSQPMARTGSDQAHSDTADRPALPSTASWASKQLQGPSRSESRATSGTMGSPAPATVLPAVSQAQQPTETQEESAPAEEEPLQQSPVQQQLHQSHPSLRSLESAPLRNLLKHFKPDDLRFNSSAQLPEHDLGIIQYYPPLFDKNGGARRRLRRQREEEQLRMEQEAQAFQQPPPVDHEENPELSGSLQLGGEPEERQTLSQPQSAISPPGNDGMLDQRFQFGGLANQNRSMTPQQHQQMLLQTMKTPNAQGSYLSNPQSSFQQQSGPPGHQRNTSRYSFANENSASTTVKPVANAKHLNQQSSIMPQTVGNHFGAQHQNHGSQFYTSNVQGPPPGLKATGTPPVSGGMTFGQGHGFATGGLQYGANNAGRNTNEEMMRSLLRGRDPATESKTPMSDDGMRNVLRDREPAHSSTPSLQNETDFPPLAPPSRQQSISIIAEEARRSTTPKIPPGLTKPSALPADLEGGGSRPSSRAGSLKRTASSQVIPALPLRPSRPGTPTPSKVRPEVKCEADETPTKARHGEEVAKVKPAVEKVEVGDNADVSQTAPAVEDVKPSVEDTTNAEVPQSVTDQQDSTPVASQAADKDQNTVESIDTPATPVTPSKSEPVKPDTQKRKHPGKIDIPAASIKDEPGPSVPTSAVDTSTPTSSVPRDIMPTPAEAARVGSPGGSLASPAAKTAKTIRVVTTPKTEPPSAGAVPKDAIPAAVRQPSRQPSLASIRMPGTPSSEQVSISDNISMTSASQSRANSPPPSAAAASGSKVGSAPIKAKTKNQLKKERQERAKVLEEEKVKSGDVPKPVEDEPAQEAIVSRKKKAKKEKEPKPPKAAKAPAPVQTEESTPTASRSTSPPKPEPAVPAKVEQPIKEVRSPKAVSVETPFVQPAPPVQSPHEPSPPPTPTLSAAQLIAELKATAPEIQKCIDSLFRTSNAAYSKSGQPAHAKDLAYTETMYPPSSASNPKLKKHEVEALLKGEVPAVRSGGKEGKMWDRSMVTPSGAHLRALTEELEMRFLELEKAIRELPEELRFKPSKPQNEIKFPTIDLEALKRQFDNSGARGPSVMEQMVQDGSTMKKGAFLVDEASKYINEFVMPPATPPSSSGNGASSNRASGGGAAAGAQQGEGQGMQWTADVVERQLNEARRVADEREGALKKVVKKNKKILGMG